MNPLTRVRKACERASEARSARLDAIRAALAAGHSQAEVAAAAGVSQQAIAKIAKG